MVNDLIDLQIYTHHEIYGMTKYLLHCSKVCSRTDSTFITQSEMLNEGKKNMFPTINYLLW